MSGRFPGWVLLLYLAIDLANPFVPGAFRFTVEEGCVWVEGTTHARYRASSSPDEAREPEGRPWLRQSGQERSRAAGPPARCREVLVWLAGVRTGDPPARDLPPPTSEDH
jgi:hypothetical protein